MRVPIVAGGSCDAQWRSRVALPCRAVPRTRYFAGIDSKRVEGAPSRAVQGRSARPLTTCSAPHLPEP